MFPNYNWLFDPNCKLIFFNYQWLFTAKLICLSQHTGEIIMSVKTPCRCDITWRSSLIRVKQFYKRLKPIFKKKKNEVGFCPPCQIEQWAFVQWDIVQWAFVLMAFVAVGFCPFPLKTQTTKMHELKKYPANNVWNRYASIHLIKSIYLDIKKHFYTLLGNYACVLGGYRF